MKKGLFILMAFICFTSCYGQKSVYIPAYLQDATTADGAQFSWDKTYQSDNFIIIWGNTVGTDPAAYTADTNLAFNPAMILDTMEYLYTAYKQFGFLDDSAGTHLSQYKIPIIMYNTWGDNGAQGYANGGDADGVIGAFWVHPIAMHTGQVAAHEFTHSLQAECAIDYRTTYGFGPEWNYSGIFWETHAQFMRNLIYPQDVTAWGMDEYHIETWGDWKNTYENYELLLAIMEEDGINMINRLWRESYSAEYPLQAYKRLSGYNQQQYNDKMFRYVRRMPTFDFNYNNIGSYFRQYRSQDVNSFLPSVQGVYNILKKVPGADNRYEMPIEQSPEESAYNVIPLYMNPDSCSAIVKFKGHTDANAHAGWRYGFVAAHADGTISRYGDIYRDTTAVINFNFESNETQMYLVVMGAPYDSILTDTASDTWHGYPKHFRFPYELTITGAVPEGFQDSALFRAQLKTDGHTHSNGGGWVQNTASVAGSVYVAPHAMVLGYANITGNVRIDNTAIVQDAVVSGNVQILDNACVNGGIYSDSAVVKGHAYAEFDTVSGNAVIDMRAHVSNYTLSGSIEVGGDVVVYNTGGNCDNGVYYTLTNYYEDNLLACDGRTASYPTNQDVNNTYTLFTDTQMSTGCNCASLPGCLTLNTPALIQSDNTVTVSPNPATKEVLFSVSSSVAVTKLEVVLYNALGVPVNATAVTGKPNCSLDVSGLPAGVYLARIKWNSSAWESKRVVVER